MKQELLPEEFIQQAQSGVIIDVRTPAEYAQGHIVGALNLPLFSDEERVVVGTLYVKQGKDIAVEKGLGFVGPKMANFVRTARKMAAGKTIYIHCWRGGMRSGSMAWLLRTAGLPVVLLIGGYKAYRNSFLEMLAQPLELKIIGGPTGCGKTDILKALIELDEQVLDIEGLAHHKGSAFGALGQLEQPTTEQFINNIHHTFRSFDLSKPVWCEGESFSTGKVSMPQQLFDLMQKANFVYLTIPTACRIERILKEYGEFPIPSLIDAFKRIERRLGCDKTKLGIEYLNDGNVSAAIEIALKYYDKGYGKSYSERWNITHVLSAESDNPMETATDIIELMKDKK